MNVKRWNNLNLLKGGAMEKGEKERYIKAKEGRVA